MNPYSVPEHTCWTSTRHSSDPTVKDGLPARSFQPESAIGTLPPEVLALIFYHATEPLRASPVLLGSVCSHWRQVAWSTPVLWTYIIPVPIRHRVQQSDAALLHLYFNNACTLPVSLHIILDRLSFSSSNAASKDLLRTAFVKNSCSIGVLTCTTKSLIGQQWVRLAPKLAASNFPKLHHFKIKFHSIPFLRFYSRLFTHAPNLSQVLFVGYQPELPDETFWERLTVLELSSLPISQCLESLVRCPNLVDFRCIKPCLSFKPVDSAMGEQHSVVTFQNLRIFAWIGEWDVFLYCYIRLPNLVHLILGISHHLSRSLDAAVSHSPNDAPTTDPDLWKTFFRQMKNLSILECVVFHSARELLVLFNIFSGTIHTLHFTAFNDASDIIRILRALQIKYGDLTTGNHFPRLKSFSATLQLRPDASEHLFNILCSRRIRPMIHAPLTSGILSVNSASEGSSLTASPSRPSVSSLLSGAPNDYLINVVVDHEYWSTHPRLEEAIITCKPTGFGFTEREREISRLLVDGGLNLQLFG